MSLRRTSFDVKAFGALPLVRRLYQALVVGLAVFLLSLVIFREPFRGYLAEVRIAGPATDELDLDDAVRWLKQLHPQIAVVTAPAKTSRRQCRIRATLIALRQHEATAALDTLAGRWLREYLPAQIQSHRRKRLAELEAAVQQARQAEDASRDRLDELRRQQPARNLLPEQTAPAAPSPPHAPSPQPPVEAIPTPGPSPQEQQPQERQMDQRLAALRLELARFLASFTEQHPRVIDLRSQIASVERELVAGELEARATPQAQPDARPTPDLAPATGGMNLPAAPLSTDHSPSGPDAELRSAAAQLDRATRSRQQAEQRLARQIHELAAGPAAADWTAEPAQTIARLGGTPRRGALAIGGVLAGLAAMIVFRLSPRAVLTPTIQTAAELARLLRLPVIGDLARPAAVRRPAGATIVRAATRLSEVVVGLAAIACVLAVAVDPPLARQIAADPFGALSAAAARFLG